MASVLQNDNLLDGLNAAQRQAVTLPLDHHGLIVSGAGTGKTRVLTTRIAYLLRNQVDAQHILAVTFTNKACREMRERLQTMVGDGGLSVAVGTFHSTGLRIIRRHAKAMGLPQHPIILDTEESENLLRIAMIEINLSEEQQYKRQLTQAGVPESHYSDLQKEQVKELRRQDRALARTFAHQIGQWKDEDYYPPSRVPESIIAENPSFVTLQQVYIVYEQQKKKHGSLDFADLLVRVNHLFRSRPEILQWEQGRLAHLLVDEFQDTNTAQYVLLGYLSARGKGARLFAVGDQDQSIYGWRGSRPELMLRFADNVRPDTVLLEENYRCSPIILDAANAVIQNNVGRIEKNLFTRRIDGLPIHHHSTEDPYEEARAVIQRILIHQKAGISLDDMAVLYRNNVLSRIMEKLLVEAGVPYRVYSGAGFYERKEIKDALAWARVVASSQDDVAMERTFTAPRSGIGAKTVDTLKETARAQQTSLLNAARLSDQAKIRAVCDKVTTLQATYQEKGLTALFKAIAHYAPPGGKLPSLHAFFLKDGKDGENRADNLDELISATAAFDSRWALGGTIDRSEDGLSADSDDPLQLFLAECALFSGEGNTLEDDTPAVNLMTVHKSKGLEFDAVFVIGLEDGLFPSQKSDLGEERRLFYVAVTRARHHLLLSGSAQRMFQGTNQSTTVSRFIGEIPPHLLEWGKDITPKVSVLPTSCNAPPELVFEEHPW